MISALAFMLLTIAFSVDAFSVSPKNNAHGRIVGLFASSRTAAGNSVMMMLGSTKNDDDFPEEKIGEAEYTGDVDWDNEWKKVVAKETTSSRMGDQERPGKDFYKSDAEIAAIRAANKAQTEVQKISNKLPSMPSASSMNLSSLTGDWRVSW